jgi:hypothetical protein
MDGLSVEVKLCGGDCSLVVSSDKFASPFTLAVKQTCASVEHHIYRNDPEVPVGSNLKSTALIYHINCASNSHIKRPKQLI